MQQPASPQAALAGLLLDPDAAIPGALFHAGEGGGAADLTRRVAVHRNTVVVSLVDALAATYPAVQSLTGERFFRAAAREFVRSSPPRGPVLAHYGGDFPAFLDAFPPASSLDYLPDVARLEWAWLRAYGAADVQPVAARILGGRDAADTAALCLRFHPAVALLRSHHPVVSLWAETTGRSERTGLDLRMPEAALVARPDLVVQVHRLRPSSATFLAALLAGRTLAMAAEAAMAEQDFDLPAELAELFDAGLVTGCHRAARDDTHNGAPS